MEFCLDTTSEDDPFTGFEDPLSYTWLDTSGDPLLWATHHDHTVTTGPSQALSTATDMLNIGSSGNEPVETWLQRTVSSSEVSDISGAIEESTDQGSLTRNTSNSSLQSLASSANSFSKRGRRIKDGYLCSSCGKTFNVPSELRHHEKNHLTRDEKPFACADCDQRFVWPKDLRRHARRRHPGSALALGHMSQPDSNMVSATLDSESMNSNHKKKTKLFQEQVDMKIDDSFTREVALKECNEGLMLPRKKRKAVRALKDAIEDRGNAPCSCGTEVKAGLEKLHLPAVEAITLADAPLRHAIFQSAEASMDRKRRTKLWLDSTKALFRGAKGLSAPLLDIYLHSLDNMAGSLDDLVVDEIDSAANKREARLALAFVIEYFLQPGEGLDRQEQLTLDRLIGRLKI